MDTLDRLVIVETGNGRGIQMKESEAKAQGLKYVLKVKAYTPAALENKMVEPEENKAEPVQAPVPPMRNIVANRKPR
jgi:hypothetical protein